VSLYLLDTNMVSFTLSGRSAAARARLVKLTAKLAAQGHSQHLRCDGRGTAVWAGQVAQLRSAAGSGTVSRRVRRLSVGQ
jgi:hypothetical protein